jgi:hypothetical protein
MACLRSPSGRGTCVESAAVECVALDRRVTWITATTFIVDKRVVYFSIDSSAYGYEDTLSVTIHTDQYGMLESGEVSQ